MFTLAAKMDTFTELFLAYNTQENLFFQFKNRYIQLISGTSEFNY